MAGLHPILLEPHGPADGGLSAWEPIAPASLTAGQPCQRGHQYYTDASGQLSAGVWDCTPMSTVVEPYEVNEFMLLLEGSVTIAQRDGPAETLRAGDCFVIPKGLPCAWQQSEYLRKFYVIFDDRSGARPLDPNTHTVTRLHLHQALPPDTAPDASLCIGALPEQHRFDAFEDASGQMRVGLWDSTALHTRPLSAMHDEFVHLLEGELTITPADDEPHRFHAGQSFILPRHLRYHVDSDGYLRTLYCRFTPRA